MSKLKLPGVIDAHVHFREPGATEKEDFTSGTKAAVAGGVTAVLDMPNNANPTVTPEALQEKTDLAKGHIFADVGFHFAAHPSALSFFDKVSDAIFGYKLYMNPTTGNLQVSEKEAEELFAAIPTDKIMIVHAEGETLQTAISLAEKYGKRLHAAHIGSASQVRMVRRAKEKGIDITSEITPHHLFLTVEDEEQLAGYGVMKPPLQSKKEQDALWEALNAGVIDIVSTDHAPHTKQQKESRTPPFGVPGVQTALPLLLHAVYTGRLSLKTLVALIHDNPKKIFALPDQPDTYVEVDTGVEQEITNESMFTKVGWTPFAGRKVFGKIRGVYLRGKKVFDGEQILGRPEGIVIQPVR